MNMCCKELEGKDLSVEGVRGLSNVEVKKMLPRLSPPTYGNHFTEDRHPW